jgi:hypothetical protein
VDHGMQLDYDGTALQEMTIANDLLSPFNDIHLDSFEKVFGTPVKRPTIQTDTSLLDIDEPLPILKTPSSRVDEFLLALHRAGYTHLELLNNKEKQQQQQQQQQQQLSKHDPKSELSERSYDYFFSSALSNENSPVKGRQSQLEGIHENDNDSNNEHDVRHISSYSPSVQEYILKKLNSLITSEDFNPDALKRNWELEEEYEEELLSTSNQLEAVSKAIEEKKKKSEEMNQSFYSATEDITHYTNSTNNPPSSTVLSPVTPLVELEVPLNSLDHTKHGSGEGIPDEEEEGKEKNERNISVESNGPRTESKDEQEEESIGEERRSSMEDPLRVASNEQEPTAEGNDEPIRKELSTSLDSLPSPLRIPSTTAVKSKKSSCSFSFNNSYDENETARYNGDFIVWSSGKMLNADYTNEIYVGLYENEITHYIDSGKLSPLMKLINPNHVTSASSSSSGKCYLFAFHLRCNSFRRSSPLLLHCSCDFFPFSLFCSCFSFPYRFAVIGNPLAKTLFLGNDPFLASQQVFQDFTHVAASTVHHVTDPNHPSHAKGFYPVHVMEVVIRPDIELKVFMSTVVKVSKKLNLKCIPLQRSHMTITPSSSTNRSTVAKISSFLDQLSAESHSQVLITSNSSSSSSSQSSLALREYDSIDIQIVVSRELRQRVLLVQFLKRVTMLSNMSLLSSMIVGPYEYIPLSRCPKTRKFINQFKVRHINSRFSFCSLIFSCFLFCLFCFIVSIFCFSCHFLIFI